jgi:hypothetical protein
LEDDEVVGGEGDWIVMESVLLCCISLYFDAEWFIVFYNCWLGSPWVSIFKNLFSLAGVDWEVPRTAVLDENVLREKSHWSLF